MTARFSMEPTWPFASVGVLLKEAHHLGLPHFQRGAVWGSSDVARLLESLFYETPLGTIILWRPAGPVLDFGAPLPFLPQDRAPDLLVLDGQQRLSALHEVFVEEWETGSPRPDQEEEADSVDAAEARSRCAGASTWPA